MEFDVSPSPCASLLCCCVVIGPEDLYKNGFEKNVNAVGMPSRKRAVE